ncbi:hypothetical protein NEUTE1DRAFT_116566 [Neurospora tetrasperma FGSC 2508]|uniref:Uncharacterized protein n=1 Tax=Neurospora tetrasperma (strain FGSC 2508 / ATCC MYA-4615 / P0657) TaxID=510951 RepID=F8MH56_NEUT8|nr:uncharacterized protein NEUTE1DRAFT_116566 [Neurospora tetrasperma FGSC 2508]EGO59572.1 hypothetical protein NEUTE1DRAFT_116566 [Neurospora tetrasperma FGSC 2508]EGZ69869.1 hypothetical protein NEUTE2DRAFT_146069 [Neurospora tetrasperma FGSC 2509]
MRTERRNRVTCPYYLVNGRRQVYLTYRSTWISDLSKHGFQKGTAIPGTVRTPNNTRLSVAPAL